MQNNFTMCIPYVGAIIEREKNGRTELLIQTRWKPERDPKYSGTIEFAAGVLDKPFENVYEAIAREIKEETGLILKGIRNDSQTKQFSPQKDDLSFGFRPFCCTQQLREGKPWIGFVFICEVEDGEIKPQESETKDVMWIDKEKMRTIFENTPEKLFALEISAWEYYFHKTN